MSVSAHSDYDPIFILEANFDGPSGVFWGQLEAAFGDKLRAMLRCCKRPLDQDSRLYDAVTELDSRSPIAPYFEVRTQRPSVFHHGNRGLDRDRILADEQLFGAVREEVDGARGASPYRGLPVESARLKLRAALLPRFAWLSEPPPKRVGVVESNADILRLLLFAAVVLLALSLPGLLLAPLLPTRSYLLLVGAAALLILSWLFMKRRGLPGTEVRTGFPWAIVQPKWLVLYLIAMVTYVAIATALLLPVVVAASHVLAWAGAAEPTTFASAWRPLAFVIVLGLAALFVSIPLLLLRIRYLELHDSSRDSPQVDDRTLRQMARREDWIAQNHMNSIVLIKPGSLRSMIIQAGHLGLGLVLRVTARDGYLGSLRTVHFAHWAFLNNRSRLLFLSNYDHSWDSYLDDFIEKAATGLTLSWGSGVGFPPSRFLFLDGAAHGRQFKNWALASRSVSRFWYSAYRHLTVDQIERNHRIANGLRAAALNDRKAGAWMADL